MTIRLMPAGILTAAFLTSMPLLAQDNDDSIETITVTGSRTPVPLPLLGSSGTVIDRQELERRQSASLSTILRDVPGFAVSRSGVQGSVTQLRVRGAEANQVLVMIDGIEANDPAQGSEFNLAHLLVREIERVEVIRGPQSALWGSDALAGVVNIITRRGEGDPTLSGFAEGGSFGTVYGGGGISGSGDRFHFNIGGSILDSAGSNISRQGNEKDGYDNTTLSFKGGYEVTDYLSFKVLGRHTDATNEFDNTDFLTGLPADSDNVTDSARDYGLIQIRLDTFGGRWEHIADGSITATENDNFTSGVETSSTQGKRYEFDYQTNYFIDTLAYGGTQHTLTFAIDYEKEDFTQRGQASAFGDPNQDLEMDSTGMIGEYRIASDLDWLLSAGIRHDSNSDFQDDTTFRLTGSYRYSATGTRLRAAYGSGSKNPTFTERFGFFAQSVTPFVGNPGLKPERSRGWEVGFEQPLLEDRARFGFTYFDEDLRDEINGFVFDPTLGPFGAFTAQNVDGISKRHGIELSGQMQVSPALLLKGMYTWLDATETDTFGNDLKEIRRPEHIASINLNYVFLNGRGNINLNMFYNGKQLDTYFPPFPQPMQRVTLDDYVFVNLTADWQLTESVSLYGRIENLLDENYEEIFGFATPGIGAYAGVRVRFQP